MQRDRELRLYLEHKRQQHQAAAPRTRAADPVGGILKDSDLSSWLARQSKLRHVCAAFLAVAGEDTCAHCQVEGVRAGVLHVTVDSASCLSELANFRKKELVAELRAHPGCGRIHDMKFQLKNLERRQDDQRTL